MSVIGIDPSKKGRTLVLRSHRSQRSQCSQPAGVGMSRVIVDIWIRCQTPNYILPRHDLANTPPIQRRTPDPRHGRALDKSGTWCFALGAV